MDQQLSCECGCSAAQHPWGKRVCQGCGQCERFEASTPKGRLKALMLQSVKVALDWSISKMKGEKRQDLALELFSLTEQVAKAADEWRCSVGPTWSTEDEQEYDQIMKAVEAHSRGVISPEIGSLYRVRHARFVVDLVYTHRWTVDRHEKDLARELDRLSIELDRVRENPEYEPRALGSVAAKVTAAQHKLFQARESFRVAVGTAATILR